MGTSAKVLIDIKVKPKTPKKIKDQIVVTVNEYVPCEQFHGNILSYEITFGFSHTGLNCLEGMKLPTSVTKYLLRAEMTIKYIEQAPQEEFDLVAEDEEEE